MKAASFRSRLIWQRGCARCSPRRKAGARCRNRCANGWRCRRRSLLPAAGELLVETFPRAANIISSATRSRGGSRTRRWACCSRAGSSARGQSRSALLPRIRAGVLGLGDLGLRIASGDLSLAQLFDEDMLGDDLEAWLAEIGLMKRTFRACAIIAGLIESVFPATRLQGQDLHARSR